MRYTVYVEYSLMSIEMHVSILLFLDAKESNTSNKSTKNKTANFKMQVSLNKQGELKASKIMGNRHS